MKHPPDSSGGRRPLVAGVTLAALRASDHAALPFNPFRLDATLAHVQALEPLGVDFVVLEDSAIDTAGVAAGDAALALEAFTLAAYLAVSTRHIGLVPVVNTNYTQPFAAARLIASLDHVCHGRAGWLAVADETGNAAANHAAAPATEALRLARQREFIDVVEKLFDSWEPGAFVRDKASGDFVDLSRAHVVGHEGPAFQVKGPLNIAASPQGRPPLLLPDGTIGTAPSALALRRVTPYVGDTHDAAAARVPGDRDDAFAGTWSEWAAHVDMLRAQGIDGVWLTPPPALTRDVVYLARLLEPFGLTEPPAAATMLTARLGLPPAINRHAAHRATARPTQDVHA
ncbi:LLM class flavin-dependent oxidoreductase [Cupriavidus plantarum]|uniref:LLM class flavin-dependent oxidoreductase n=1 Tax=Cupriavidus plantarum TaxID=942865 RepID=UPI001B1BFF64|nr:LLM class flavin-dependent oxidoreductase [Cupriavidus plantarum]CAG2138618.1 hypothetical protein LMG26296_02742 [Cupriavidus plantarum]SMR85846.1 Luciferase-like monooxygenase [Cupriavidus plantarum]